jgi:hypothetical protein
MPLSPKFPPELLLPEPPPELEPELPPEPPAPDDEPLEKPSLAAFPEPHAAAAKTAATIARPADWRSKVLSIGL